MSIRLYARGERLCLGRGSQHSLASGTGCLFVYLSYECRATLEILCSCVLLGSSEYLLTALERGREHTYSARKSQYFIHLKYVLVTLSRGWVISRKSHAKQ